MLKGTAKKGFDVRKPLNKLLNSLQVIFAGCLILLLAVILLFLNEGRLQTARVVGRASQYSEGSSNSGLIYASGVLAASDVFSDDFGFLSPDNRLYLRSRAEMYAWAESFSDGAYSYAPKWTDKPADSSEFSLPYGHENSQSAIALTKSVSAVKYSAEAYIDGLNVNIEELGIESFAERMELASNAAPGVGIRGNYVYIAEPGASGEDPNIGDVRIAYYEVKALEGTVVGGLKDSALAPQKIKVGAAFFRTTLDFLRFFDGVHGINEAAKVLEAEVKAVWALRAAGTAIIYAALLLLLEPMKNLLSFILRKQPSIKTGAVLLVPAAFIIAAPTILTAFYIGHTVSFTAILGLLIALIYWGFSSDGYRKKLIRPLNPYYVARHAGTGNKSSGDSGDGSD